MLPGLLFLAASGGFADWRQFRGPGGAALAPHTEVPATLSLDKNLVWKASLPGRGLSSPIVVGDRVFVTCASGPKQERLHVFCFNAADGAKRWERQFWATGRTMCHEKTCVAAPTPVSDGTLVFAVFSSNDAVCLDLDGNLLWFRGLGRDYPNASNSLGMSSSPVAAEGVWVAQVENDSESFAVGLDAASGVNRWKLERPKVANWTSPSLYTNSAGRLLVLLQSERGLTGVEPATGRVAWDYGAKASPVPSSVVAGSLIYLPAAGLTALQPGAEGQPPQELWRAAQLRPGTPSPLAVGDRLFLLNDGGILTCGEAATGKRLWQLRLKGPFSSTPIAAGTRLYCVNEKGLVQIIDTTKPEGEVTGELALGETILSTAAVGPGAIYWRSDHTLWKFGAARD